MHRLRGAGAPDPEKKPGIRVLRRDGLLRRMPAGGEAFAKRKKELLDKEVEFKERQKSSLKEFLGKQTLKKKSFFVQQDADRAEAHAQYQKATQDYKIAKRRANEEFMDKLAIAYAEYNKERVAAGEQPVYYDNRREKSAEAHKAGYQEYGWPEEPESEAEA